MPTGEDAHGCDYFTSIFLLPQLCNSTWEGLDGRQQRTLVSALEASTRATEEAESAGLAELRERGLIAEA